VKEDNQTN